MKLRLTTNSIRIRVRKSELATLADELKIVDSVRFLSGDLFKFELAISNSKTEVTAEIVDKLLIVFLPELEANSWVKTEQVGIETYIVLNEAEKLHVLIEKDFPCKDRADEDKSDEDKSDTFAELVDDQRSAC